MFKRQKRVLVIDDDSHICDFITLVLMQYNVTPVICDSFEAAFVNNPTFKYDLVIADVFMAGMGALRGSSGLGKKRPT